MKLSRRDLLRLGPSREAGTLLLPKRFAFAQSSPALTPFVDPLPIPPVLPRARGAQHPHAAVHPEAPPRPAADQAVGVQRPYLGPTFEARPGSPISVQWLNDLPSHHFLPIDHTIHGAESNVPDVRTVVHLHGAKVFGDSDGYPEAWFTNDFAQTGPSSPTGSTTIRTTRRR